MNIVHPTEKTIYWIRWSTVSLLAFFAIGALISSFDLFQRATVTIDDSGTARLGGIIPLRNTHIRELGLRTAARLNGRRASMVVGESTSFRNILEMDAAMQKAGITSVVIRTAPKRPISIHAVNTVNEKR